MQIDVSPENEPNATIIKKTISNAAALASDEPSLADRKVAALAEALRAQAQADLDEQRAAERRSDAVDV